MKTNKLFIFVIFIMCALLLVGCKKNEDNTTVDNYTKPALTDPEAVEYKKDSISVTKEEILKAMKVSNLIGVVVNEIDKDLLADTLSTIETTDFYKLAENYVLYGDPAILDSDKDDETKNESLNNLYLNGYRIDGQTHVS